MLLAHFNEVRDIRLTFKSKEMKVKHVEEEAPWKMAACVCVCVCEFEVFYRGKMLTPLFLST